MARLGDIARKIRSKNAGPFWLTIDIFMATDKAFATVESRLATAQIAQVFAMDVPLVKRFSLPALRVVKFSLPRPEVQGSIFDRDIHGASWAALISALDIGDGG